MLFHTLRDFGKQLSHTLACVTVMLLLCGIADSASALTLTPQVDQSIIVVEQASLAVSSGNYWGQSFTVGQSGYLTEIDFQMGRQSSVVQPLDVQVRLANGDLPNMDPSGLLYSGSIDPADVPVVIFTDQFTTSLTLGSGAPLVTSGEKLDVLLTTTDPNWYQWDNSGDFNSNPYPNGTAIYSFDGVNWGVQTNWDFGFQTWVAPVPEPSALLPFGLLMLPVACWLRKFIP